MRTVTCSTCRRQFQRYSMTAKRAAKPQYCSKTCLSVAWAESRKPVEELFWPKVDMRHHSECWEWAGHRRALGYGWFNYRGRPTNAHRVAYRLAVGEIPPGMFVCHTCDNPPCCNPSHLWLGTVRDNTHDMITKGRSNPKPPRGEKSPNAKLTYDQVLEIVASPASNSELAESFKVTATAIYNIRRGKAWSHVTGIRA